MLFAGFAILGVFACNLIFNAKLAKIADRKEAEDA
jgi:hypothetical protein